MFRSARVLVAARALAGMSQAELAAAAGIAVSVLQAIEQGRSDPRLSTAIALVDALKRRGVEVISESDRNAWGVLVVKGSEAERLGTLPKPTNRAAADPEADSSADLKA
jgi:DNA-binding XRE family transcriptional regulator